jgi:hypothetical protein
MAGAVKTEMVELVIVDTTYHPIGADNYNRR